MARRRLIRDEPRLSDDTILVRGMFDNRGHGHAFDRDLLIADVTYNFDEFGYYGLSLWGVTGAWPLDRIWAEKTRRARRVALFSAGALRTTGLGVTPSGRTPHYDANCGPVYGDSYGSASSATASAVEFVDRFGRAPYTVCVNSWYRPDPLRGGLT